MYNNQYICVYVIVLHVIYTCAEVSAFIIAIMIKHILEMCV